MIEYASLGATRPTHDLSSSLRIYVDLHLKVPHQPQDLHPNVARLKELGQIKGSYRKISQSTLKEKLKARGCRALFCVLDNYSVAFLNAKIREATNANQPKMMVQAAPHSRSCLLLESASNSRPMTMNTSEDHLLNLAFFSVTLAARFAIQALKNDFFSIVLFRSN